MEHSRKQKLLMIIALVMGIASLSIGFAAFSVSLNISSSASVTPSSDTFSVKFSTSPDELIVEELPPSSYGTGVSYTNGIINNTTNPTLSNLSVSFESPGQVTYEIWARNEGEYDAYLNSVNFIGQTSCVAEPGTTPSLVQKACENIQITVAIEMQTYSTTTEITNHILKKHPHTTHPHTVHTPLLLS